VNRQRPAERARWRHSTRPDAYLVACALLLAVLAPAAAFAQTRPTVSVTATLPAESASQVPLVIAVGPPDSLPKGSFIRVRGLPPMAALSEGHSIAPGSWAVPISALPNLRVTLPAAVTGSSEIIITLVAIDGAVLAEARSTLMVAARQPPVGPPQGKTAAPPLSILRAGPLASGSPETADASPGSASPIAASKLSPAERDRALRLVKKGDQELAEGGIAQARLLYERAAEAGLPDGAMALAATYDAAELGRLGVRGLQPDPAAAKRWYERAQQLGSTEAAQRLRRLGAN
jgi:hypothetical protein